jgi:hypothetical protein
MKPAPNDAALTEHRARSISSSPLLCPVRRSAPQPVAAPRTSRCAGEVAIVDARSGATLGKLKQVLSFLLCAWVSV